VEFRELLGAEFAPFGTLSDTQIALLERHYSLLTHWNRRMNLTRIEKLEDAVRMHYCESLFLGRALPPGALRIADVGSGAGFPGFPVAVLRPESTVDLIDSHQRKGVFLREVSAGIDNLAVITTRAEALVGSYDWTVSRAVRPSEVLAMGLAPRAAILMSRGDLEEMSLQAFEVKLLPWGVGRVLALFSLLD